VPRRLLFHLLEFLLLLLLACVCAHQAASTDRQVLKPPSDTYATTVLGSEPSAPRPLEPISLHPSSGNVLRDFFRFLSDVASGDLSRARDPSETLRVLFERSLPATLWLVTLSVMLATLLGFSSAWVLSVGPSGRWRRLLARAVLGFAEALPAFVLAPLLVLLFALTFSLLPPARLDGPATLVLPVLSIGIPSSGVLAGLLLSAARTTHAASRRGRPAPGVTRREIWGRFLRTRGGPSNSLADIAGRVLAAAAPAVVAVEVVFQIPGVGRALHDAILTRDASFASGIFLVIAVGLLTIRLLAALVLELTALRSPT
jgi:peptide/nickel transport system permease protein